MKKNLIRRALPGLASFWLVACAQTSVVQTPALASQTAQPDQTSDAVNATSRLAPDVRATCSAAAMSMRSVSQHPAETADRIRACLSSRELPVTERLPMLQGLALNEVLLQDYKAAIDALAAAIDLEPVPRDEQLFMLATLYDSTHQYSQGLATLDRIRGAHESAHDLDSAIGVPYYMELGKLLAASGRHQEAIDALSKVIQRAPALANAYRVRASERESIGNMTGARADYVEFARWAPEQEINAPLLAKLSGLGIDVESERRHPFGNANPLLEFSEQSLVGAQLSLKAASTPLARAKAYGNISAWLDNTGQREQALATIDQAIALAPDDAALKQSKVTTLVGLNRPDEAIVVAKPILAQMQTELLGAKDPAIIYRKYAEVTGSSAWAYMLKGNWTNAVDMIADRAEGADPVDQDYLASLYLVVRARSTSPAPTNAFLDDYIRRSEFSLVVNYRRALLWYMSGRVSLNVVYAMIGTTIHNRAALQNALAETWMIAAARERFVNHDETTAQTYRARIEDLRPYGTSEWDMVRYGGV